MSVKVRHVIARPISCYVTTSCNLFNISSFHFIFPNLKRSPIEKRHAKHRVTLLYLCVLLLARSSDIALNPGPDSSNFPCGYCHKEVTWSDIMSLMCDNCDQWFHADCQGIGNTTFDILSHSKATWYCHQCNFPNYSTGLFATLDTLSDTSSILNSSYFCSTSQEASSNDDSTINIGSPQASSSPMAPKQPRKKPPKIKSKPLPTRLTVLNINCRSVVEKKLELKYLTDQTRPDIIAGTESWLNDSHYNNEIFDTDSYSIFRKDRKNRKGGGVFLAMKHYLNLVGQPELDSESEIIWAKIDLPGLKNVFICSFYKPKENDHESIDALRNSLSKIPKTSYIWALGDFNLPHIDWETEQIKSSCPCKHVYESFLDTLHDFSLEQVVKEPTREDNILDLFLLNQPSLVHSTKILPPLGQGDHDIVHHELKINLGKRKQKQRPIKLFKKTDWDGFRSEMKAYHQTYLENHSSCDTNTKWTEFKNTLNNLTEKYVPTKMCKPKDGHPWVTCSIKRLINKRDRLYSKYKQDRSNSTLKLKFTSLKHSIQKQLRESYNNYIESIVMDQQDNNSNTGRPNKRLYTFIKQQKSDSREI